MKNMFQLMAADHLPCYAYAGWNGEETERISVRRLYRRISKAPRQGMKNEFSFLAGDFTFAPPKGKKTHTPNKNQDPKIWRAQAGSFQQTTANRKCQAVCILGHNLLHRVARSSNCHLLFKNSVCRYTNRYTNHLFVCAVTVRRSRK